MVVNTLELPVMLDDCPKFWQNFIAHCETVQHTDTFHRRLSKVVNDELSLYEAAFSFVDDGEISTEVNFLDEKKYVWFMLRWS